MGDPLGSRFRAAGHPQRGPRRHLVSKHPGMGCSDQFLTSSTTFQPKRTRKSSKHVVQTQNIDLSGRRPCGHAEDIRIIPSNLGRREFHPAEIAMVAIPLDPSIEPTGDSLPGRNNSATVPFSMRQA